MKKTETGEKSLRPNKAELIILLIIVVIGAALVLIFLLMRKPGGEVIVSVDGKEVARYQLTEDIDTVIQGIGGTNHLVISGGSASVTDADCPDKLCVGMGAISHVGDSIVCLPHRLSVRIAGDDTAAPDAVVS